MKKLLLTGRFKYSHEQIHKISSIGYKIFYHDQESVPLNEEELECEVLINLNLFPYNSVSSFTNLKFVQSTMVGTDEVPLDELKKIGVKYSNAQKIFSIPIAEFIIMRILEIFKNARSFQYQQDNRVWKKIFDLHEMTGKKIGILGTGDIGIETAKRLKSFGAYTIGYNRSGRNVEYFDEIHNITTIKKTIGECNVIIIAIPLDSSTYHMFDDELFSIIKKETILINVGRGAIVEEMALIKALKGNILMGAAIDVFENEPLDKDSELWGLNNFFYSPHNSFASTKNDDRLFELIYTNLNNYYNNYEVKNII